MLILHDVKFRTVSVSLSKSYILMINLLIDEKENKKMAVEPSNF